MESDAVIEDFDLVEDRSASLSACGEASITVLHVGGPFGFCSFAHRPSIQCNPTLTPFVVLFQSVHSALCASSCLSAAKRWEE